MTEPDPLYALNDAISALCAEHGWVSDLDDDQADAAINDAVHAAYERLTWRSWEEKL